MEGVVGDVKVGSCVGQCDHKMVEFLILVKVGGGQQSCCLGLRGENMEMFLQGAGRGGPVGVSPEGAWEG